MVLLEGLPTEDGFVAEAHVELYNFAGGIPAGDGGGLVNSLDEKASSHRVLLLTAIVQWNVGGPLDAVMVILGLGHLGLVEACGCASAWGSKSHLDENIGSSAEGLALSSERVDRL